MATAHAYRVGVVLIAVVFAAVAGEGGSNGDLTYAKIKLTKTWENGTVDELEQMSGVYALYAPGSSVSGMLVIANPLDGCSATSPPASSRPFIVLARLDASSTCTPLEQVMLAQQSGASGVINMAPTRSSFIYLLEKTRAEVASEAADPSIPQVAVSGSSGYRLLSSALANPDAVVSIAGPSEEAQANGILDLVVAIACMTVALIVLAYAFRVGRALCMQQPMFIPREESIEDIELRHQHVKRLLTELPIEPYELKEGSEDACAICLEPFDDGEDVRVLRCSHFFHVDCIDPWLLNKANCPLCKDEVLKGIEWLENDDGNFDNESMSARSAAQVHSAHRHPLDLTFDVAVAGAPTLPLPPPPPPHSRIGGGYSPRLPRATEGSLRRRTTSDEDSQTHGHHHHHEIEMVAMTTAPQSTTIVMSRILPADIVAAAQHSAVPTRGLLADRRGMYLPRGVAPPVVSTSSLGSPTTKPALSEHSSGSSLQRHITAQCPPPHHRIRPVLSAAGSSGSSLGHRHVTAQNPSDSMNEDAGGKQFKQRGIVREMSESELQGLLPVSAKGDDEADAGAARPASKMYDMKGVTLTRRSTGGQLDSRVTPVTSDNVYERPVYRNPLYKATDEGSAVSYAAVQYDDGQGGGRSALQTRLADGIGGGKVNSAPLARPPMPSSRLREQRSSISARRAHQHDERDCKPRAMATSSSSSTIKSMHSIV